MAPLDAGTVLGGRFRLHGVVGRGGTATVHLAEDLLRGERVALKVVHPHLAADPAVRRRLRREVEAAAMLHGHGMLTPFDLHAIDGHLALSMPFHGGRTLREHVAARGPMSAQELRALGLRLSGALAEAHACGVLHRDLTPANVMIETGGADAVLTDFGLARTMRSAQTRSTGLLGTVGYAAPEVYDGERADPRSDLYGLGTCLYLAATGRSAFPVDHPMGALKAQLDEDFIPLSEARPDLPPDLVAAIEALLRAAPAHRPDGAAEVRELLAGRALPPPTPPTRSPSVQRQYLPPGTWTVVVEDGKHDGSRRKSLRGTRRGRRTTEGELHRIGQTLFRGLKEAFGVHDEPHEPELQLLEAVATEAQVPHTALALPGVVYDRSFRLVDRTDEVTARRLAAAAQALGFRSHAQDTALSQTLLDLFSRFWWVIIAVGWTAFPFFVALVSTLMPGLEDVAAIGTLLTMVVLSIVLPVFGSARRKRHPQVDALPVAFTADLRELAGRTDVPAPQYAAAPTRLSKPSASPAAAGPSTAPSSPATAAMPRRSSALKERADSALDALEQAIVEQSAQLPAPAITDLRHTAAELRRASTSLADQARNIEDALEGTALDDTDVAALQSRLDRLRTLQSAGESVDSAELGQLQRALDAHARDASALDSLESRYAAVGARLLEVCSAAHQARRELLGTSAERVSTDEAMARLQREVVAARRAAQLDR